MSARYGWDKDVIHHLSQLMPVDQATDMVASLKREVAHEEAEKIRASSPWASHEATWHRHLLYGMSGETFEAQTTLDALGKAITEVHAKLIDPYVTE